LHGTDPSTARREVNNLVPTTSEWGVGRVTLNVSLFCRPHEVPGGSLRSCIDVARDADAAGLYSIHFGEHLVMGARPDRYPYGTFAHGEDTPWLEPMTTLAAMAAVTERIRLSTGVLLAPLRPAVLLAKTVATLDVLSDGRVELGVGTGWQPEEYDAAGVQWASRRRLLDDTIAACRQLWGPQPATFASETVSFTELTALPRPVQTRVPILYGVAVTPRSAATIAQLGDGWCPVGHDVDHVSAGIELLRRAFAASGRASDELRVRVRLPDATFDGTDFDFAAPVSAVPALLETGVTVFGLSIPAGLDSMDDMRRYLDAVGAWSRGFAGASV
jgi:probable F420-dependent oxidoreductase